MRSCSISCLMIVSLAVFAGDSNIPDHAATVRYMESLGVRGGGYVVAASSTLGKEIAPGIKIGNSRLLTSIRATSGIVRAVPKFGGRLKHPKDDADFVNRCYFPDIGGFAEHPGRVPDVFHTAVGLLAAVELKMPLDKYRDPSLKFLDKFTETDDDIRITAAALEALDAKSPKAEAWIKQVTAKRNADGTLGKDGEIPVRTAGMAVTVLRLGGELPNRDTVVRVLREGQCFDGGYGVSKDANSDLESCYRVVRALVMLKEKPKDVEALKKFVIGCQNRDGGYGLKKDDESSASGCYYAGFVLDWLGMNHG
jgi:prenyltransferase beta subunit